MLLVHVMPRKELLHLSIAFAALIYFFLPEPCHSFSLGSSPLQPRGLHRCLLAPQYFPLVPKQPVRALQLSSSSSASAAEGGQASTGGADTITILGLGSLLSERSSRLTFPSLRNFCLGRVPNHRRVFMHPAAIFFERGIANMETLEISSLSCEECDGASFVCSVFEVPKDEILVEGDQNEKGTIIPSQAYLEREEEFDIVEVPYLKMGATQPSATGIICRRWTDDKYAQRWGPERLAEKYGPHGITSIWDQWTKPDSGILPCGAYLRHCVLAAKKMGPTCYDSFLDDTYLADRKTTIRQCLATKPEVMQTVPPGELAVRYGG